MAQAYKLPSGQWRCQPFANGKRGNIIADSKIEAEYLAKKWKEETLIEEKKLPFQIAAENYIAARSAVYSPKTIKECKSMLGLFSEEIKTMDVHNIDHQLIQWWVNNMAVDLSPKTVSNRYGFLSAVIHDYHPEIRIGCRLPQRKKTELYIPSTEEVKHLLDIFQTKDSDMYTATLTASNMGMRRGEICALPNNKEEFKKNIIDIHQSFAEDADGNLVLKTPKTYNSQRVLHAPDHVSNHLMGIPASWEYIVKLKPNYITMHFIRTVKKEFDHPFRFHDLRHYFASVLLAENIPEKYIMEILGHSSPNMIRNVYGHIMKEKETEIKKQISSSFSAFR